MTGASIHLVAGRRYGLCGRNGLGKTTLLKMISRYDLCTETLVKIYNGTTDLFQSSWLICSKHP